MALGGRIYIHETLCVVECGGGSGLERVTQQVNAIWRWIEGRGGERDVADFEVPCTEHQMLTKNRSGPTRFGMNH